MARRKLYIDLETRSRCELKTEGAYNYARHPSTEILIACYAFDDGPVKTWRADQRGGMPLDLMRALDDPRTDIVAHNAQFERLMIDTGNSKIHPSRYLCTMTQARAAALPGALEDLPIALGMQQKKDYRGKQLIQLLSKPQEDGSFNNDPALLAEFARYCAQDVAVMRGAHRMLPAMTDECRALYAASETVNDRGLPIDTDLCEWATLYREEEAADAEKEIVKLSGGALRKARGTTLTGWIHDRLSPDAQKLMHVYRTTLAKARDQGAPGRRESHDAFISAEGSEKVTKRTLTLDAATREALLELAAENPEMVPDEVAQVIELADAVSSASVSKFATMQRLVGDDGNLRGAFVTNGASQTGRFSSKGAQVHNFPRKVAEDPEKIRLLMKRHAPLPGAPIQTLKSMLRPAIRPKKGYVVRADWNAIEARGLPWLAGSAGAVRYLDAFRDPKRDIYVEQAHAAGLHGKDARQAGKVVVLSLGYGGSVGALAAMSKGYGVTIENPEMVVRNWRNANRWAVDFWYDLARAARSAILTQSTEWRRVGRVAFAMEPLGLAMRLPSGRILHYPFAKLGGEQGDVVTYLKAAWKPKDGVKEWPRAKAWHGTFAENATQATCADLLRHSIRLALAPANGLPLIGHVHDELICEAASLAEAKEVASELKRIMMSLPRWAAGFPVAAEVHIARTFTK